MRCNMAIFMLMAVVTSMFPSFSAGSGCIALMELEPSKSIGVQDCTARVHVFLCLFVAFGNGPCSVAFTYQLLSVEYLRGTCD